MTDAEKRQLARFRQCGARDREAVLVLAEFLASRDHSATPSDTIAVPEPVPRRAQESVAMAIERLTRTDPMLDCRKMMGPTSIVMSQHVLQSRPATEAIDELEVIFERHYVCGRDM